MTYSNKQIDLIVRESTLPIELGPITGKPYRSSLEIVRSFRQLEMLAQEVFIVAHLDAKNTLVSLQTVSAGTMNSSLVHPREVFRVAIASGSTSIICIHNHPSGSPDPSGEDHEITKRLVQAGKIIGIPVLDHIVIGSSGRYFSFADEGEL